MIPRQKVINDEKCFETLFGTMKEGEQRPLDRQAVYLSDLVERLKELRKEYNLYDKNGERQWVVEKVRELGYDDDEFMYRDSELLK